MALTYGQFIQNILDTRGRFNCEGYKERHHIIPKCMGGSNENENLIDLYAREHFEAHRLLGLENPENYSLVYAWWNMCQINGNTEQTRYVPTPEEYEEARLRCAKVSSERVVGEKHPMYGKHHTDDTKHKMSVAHKGRLIGELNPMYGKHHDDEWKKNNSDMMKKLHASRQHPMSRRVICGGVVYNSIKECAECYGCTRGYFEKMLTGREKISKKYKELGLAYYEEE